MWVLLAAATTAALLSRGLGLRESGGGPTPRALRVLPAVLLLSALAVALAQTIVLAVLAGLAQQLGTDAVGATWLLTAFMLASAVATPLAGRLGDQVGHRRIVVAGLVLLILGSVIAAVSTGAGWYPGAIVGRVIQGVSGGVFPCAFGLVRVILPSTKLPGVIAALSAMFGFGGALGLVAAGPLSDWAGLMAVFWLIAALGALALIGMLLIPAPTRQSTSRQTLDSAGAVLLAATLVSLLLTITQGRSWGWSSPVIRGLALAAIAFAGLFLMVERRTPAPLIDPRLLVGRRLLALNVATVVIGVGMFASITLLPLFAQTSAQMGYGFGYSPSRTGLLIAPIAVAMVLAAPLTPRLAGVLGSRGVFQLGAVLAAIGLLGLGIFREEPVQVAASGAVIGLAYGLVFGSLGNLVISASPRDQTGAATGVNTILRTVGGAVGAAVAVAIVAGTGHGASEPPAESGYTTAFIVSALIAAAAALIATAMPPGRPVGAPETTRLQPADD